VELHGKDATPNSLKDEVHSHVRAILEAPHEDRAPKAMRILETWFYDASAVLSLPEKYRKRLRPTNSIERLNEEIRRRERVIRISQIENQLSAWLGVLLMGKDEKCKNTLLGVKARSFHKHVR